MNGWVEGKPKGSKSGNDSDAFRGYCGECCECGHKEAVRPHGQVKVGMVHMTAAPSLSASSTSRRSSPVGAESGCAAKAEVGAMACGRRRGGDKLCHTGSGWSDPPHGSLARVYVEEEGTSVAS